MLDLLSGVIALRTSAREYDEEIRGIIACERDIFGDTALLTSGAKARKHLALCDNLPTPPRYSITRCESAGSLGMHTTIKELLDHLAGFPSWRKSIDDGKKLVGLLVSTNAKFGASGGVVSTVASVANTNSLQQSSRQVFTLDLSNGDDSMSDLQNCIITL